MPLTANLSEPSSFTLTVSIMALLLLLLLGVLCGLWSWCFCCAAGATSLGLTDVRLAGSTYTYKKVVTITQTPVKFDTTCETQGYSCCKGDIYLLMAPVFSAGVCSPWDCLEGGWKLRKERLHTEVMDAGRGGRRLAGRGMKGYVQSHEYISYLNGNFYRGGPSFQIKIQVMGSVIEKALKRFYFQYPRSISDDYSCF